VPRIILHAIIKLGLLFLCVNVCGLICFFRSGEDVSTSADRLAFLLINDTGKALEWLSFMDEIH